MSTRKTFTSARRRLQHSVFECNLEGNLLDQMIDRIEKIIDQKEDSVRIYALCGACERVIRIIGTGKVTRDQDVYIL